MWLCFVAGDAEESETSLAAAVWKGRPWLASHAGSRLPVAQQMGLQAPVAVQSASRDYVALSAFKATGRYPGSQNEPEERHGLVLQQRNTFAHRTDVRAALPPTETAKVKESSWPNFLISKILSKSSQNADGTLMASEDKQLIAGFCTPCELRFCSPSSPRGPQA